ncbi:hypothetical protein GCM10025859_48380 [Alicyclobacillus fastidiosus]|nr:hypothetical protein GCM10025859_48380 [Alicyclobacillus fastidiosus]
MHIGYTGATFDPVDEVKVRGFNAEFFLQTVDQMIEEIHQVPPAAGVTASWCQVSRSSKGKSVI